MTYTYRDEFYGGRVAGRIIIRQNADGTVSSFGEWPANTDYQQYLAWIAEGNEPLPAEE